MRVFMKLDFNIYFYWTGICQICVNQRPISTLIYRKFSCGQETKATNKYRNVTHCLFDLDGTLVNSEVMYHVLVREICKKHGKDYPKSLEVEMYGKTNREITDTIVKRLHLNTSAIELQEILKKKMRENIHKMPLQEGAERLLLHLHDNKIPFALATNATKGTLDVHIKVRPTMFALFHHLVCIDNVKRGKPHPDIYLKAAHLFPDKPKPTDCLVFEDSITGMRAGIAAGMQVVMISKDELKFTEKERPTLIIQSLLQFKPEEFGLPPFKC